MSCDILRLARMYMKLSCSRGNFTLLSEVVVGMNVSIDYPWGLLWHLDTMYVTWGQTGNTDNGGLWIIDVDQGTAVRKIVTPMEDGHFHSRTRLRSSDCGQPDCLSQTVLDVDLRISASLLKV